MALARHPGSRGWANMKALAGCGHAKEGVGRHPSLHVVGRFGEGPRKGEKENPLYPCRHQHPRRLSSRGSSSQDVVHEDHGTGDRSDRTRCRRRGSPECKHPLDVSQAGIPGQGNLAWPGMAALEKKPNRVTGVSSHSFGKALGLVVPALADARCRGWNGHEWGVGIEGKGTEGREHGPCHLVRQFGPSTVLECVDERAGHAFLPPDPSHAPQLFRPIDAFGAVHRGGYSIFRGGYFILRAGWSGSLAPGAAREGHREQTPCAAQTDSPGPSVRTPPCPRTTREAGRWQDKIEKRRPRFQSTPASRRISRRASSKDPSGGGKPHHRAKAAIPCPRSISPPSRARIPRACRARIHGVRSAW